MRRRDVDLLSQIEEAGLSGDVPVADALRKCVALGGRAGSTELRTWAQQELQGYLREDLPAYRRVPAPLRIDAVRGNQYIGGSIITGQRISPRELPDVVSDTIKEEVELRQPIGELEQLVRESGDLIRMSPPLGADILALMNRTMTDEITVIHELYWAVSKTTVVGVIDQVRTTLVALMAEIRAGLPEDTTIPSSELADQAVQVIVHGNRNSVLTTAAASTDAAASITIDSEEGGASRAKQVAWWFVGIATIAGAVFAGWQVLLT